MQLRAVVAAVFVASLPALGVAGHEDWPKRNIVDTLVPSLSGNASVYLPGSDGFDEATSRWSQLGAPNITIVVEVATEDDVVSTVQYANSNDIPFIAINGGHGAITSLGSVHHGIEIWLHQLNKVSFAADGQTATFEGGARTLDVSDALAKAGKRTTHGVCECTSLLGPGLGGGHGLLQGYYGLIIDQFVELRMVLANGTVVTLNEDSPLWWAVKGAGHNFGIVTSATLKVYDTPEDGLWSYKSFTFTHDKVEAVFTALNNDLIQDGAQSPEVVHWGIASNIPAIDPDHVSLVVFIVQEGVTEPSAKYTASLIDIGPAVMGGGNGTFDNIPIWTGMDLTAAVCQDLGLMEMRFPVDLMTYNVSAQRQIVDILSNFTQQYPAYNNSLVLLEGYSTIGVKAVDPDTTAFPHRNANLLVSPLVVYAPSAETSEDVGRDLGDRLRQILFESSGLEHMYSYVNYAYGNEGPEAWYGYEPWRLEKLRALKAEYDPEGRFSFYAPFG